MPESLTQIQDDTCKIHRFKVNLQLISSMFCAVSAFWVSKCCLGKGKGGRYVETSSQRWEAWVSGIMVGNKKRRNNQDQLKQFEGSGPREKVLRVSQWCILNLQLIASGELGELHTGHQSSSSTWSKISLSAWLFRWEIRTCAMLKSLFKTQCVHSLRICTYFIDTSHILLIKHEQGNLKRKLVCSPQTKKMIFSKPAGLEVETDWETLISL